MKTVKLDYSDWQKIKIEAAKLNVSIQSLIKEVISEGLESAKKKILQNN